VGVGAQGVQTESEQIRMADNFRRDRSRGPIAELARLISQVHGERAHADSDFGEVTASIGYDKLPRFPPAPQLPVDLNGPEQAFELREHLYDDKAHHLDDQPCAADEWYQNEVPRVRRRSLTLVMAITGLAVVGTAGAFGYRDIFGGSVLPNPQPNINVSNEPNTIAPASSQLQAKSSGNESQVGAETTGSIENMLSHGEQAVTHSTAAPIALAKANSTPEVTRPALGRGYAVQVTSERSEIRAQDAFRALRAKYPDQLRGRQAIIRRADLGAAGIHYRALVGPFGSAEKAAKLCSGLKAAGGDCIIRKN
jgi:cell division septation protein DedD